MLMAGFSDNWKATLMHLADALSVSVGGSPVPLGHMNKP